MSSNNKTQTEFDIRKILRKLLEALNIKIDNLINRKNNECTKAEFFNRIKHNEIIDFPISRDTYYNYSAFVKKPKISKDDKHIGTIDLNTFFEICKYTDVSADYFLGFCDTTRKEPSAETVRQDFGLSDKAMKRLAEIKNSTPEFKGDISSDIVNAILENDLFWSKLRDYLPICVSCMNEVRAADEDVDIARFGLNRVFNELIDELCIVADGADLPNVELDDTDVVYRKTAE